MPKGIPKNGINKGWFKKHSKHTQEWKDFMSKKMKGNTHGFQKEHKIRLNIKHTIKAIKKIRIKNKGKHYSPGTEFKRGHKINFGKHQSKETKKKIGKANKGKLTGKNNPSKKIEVREKIRQSHLKRWDKIGRKKYKRPKHTNWEYNKWRSFIFKRDNWTCQKYNIRGCKIEAHHIQNFADFPKLRFVTNNGITLSKKAHKEFHKIYGQKNNTKEQIKKFKKE